ncbi:UBX domain-containing protein 10 [Rhizina undulata]
MSTSSSSNHLDIAQLTESQQSALQQFTSVTASSPSVAIPILRRAEWNVEIAITRFFDGDTAPPPPTSTATTLPRNTAVRRTPTSPRRTALPPAPRIVPQPSSVARRPPFIISLLLFPFSLLWRLSHSFIALFQTLFPFLRFRTSTSNSTRLSTIRRHQNPRDTAARFIRAFEEEYGTPVPPFFEGGYAQALDLSKSSLRYLLVVLQSEDHDDTATFNKQTLSHASVSEFIKEKDIILWAGSVQDSEAYQVSTALGCTGFPFLALIAYTPSSATNMSILTRVITMLPPNGLIAKLDAAIAAHEPTLETVRVQRATTEVDRAIREQQNSAYELSLAADRERTRLRKEAAAREAAENEAEQARIEAERKEKRQRKAWRKWKKDQLAEEKKEVRVSVRLRDGSRVVRWFGKDVDVEEVYAWVECCYPNEEEESRDEEGEVEEEWEGEKGFMYRFRLVNVLPRRVFEPREGSVGECLGGSGNLVVEDVDDEE